MAASLTPQAIERIHQGQAGLRPNVQVTDIKLVTDIKSMNQPQSGMASIVINDGTHFQQCMIATQLNKLVTSNQLQVYGIVQIHEYLCNDVQGKKIFICLKMQVMAPSTGLVIGHPVEYQSMSRQGGGPARGPTAVTPLNTMAGVGAANQSRTYNAGVPGGAPSYRGPHTAQAGPPANQNPSYGGGGQPYGGSGAGYRGSSAPVIRHEPQTMAIPISDLNPYQNRWTIKARITNMSPVKRWSNARGEGTLFSIDLLDEYGGEIRGTFFSDACEFFHPRLREGGVFFFSGGRLKVANRQFSSLKNEYEITFDRNSQIEPAPDEGKIKSANFSFRKISETEQIAPNSTMDVLGVVRSFTPESTITTRKDGREIPKRELTLVDDSNTEVRITLWSDRARDNPEQWENHPIVAFKGVKVTDYNGRSLGTLPSSLIQVNPDLPEAAQLHNWWHNAGATMTSVSLSTGGGAAGAPVSFEQRHFLSQIKDEHMGFGEKPDFVEVKGTIEYFRTEPDPWYKSCTSGDCKRKVTEQLGNFYCEKCQRSMPDCAYRYILNTTVSDHTGSVYMTCFDAEAQQILTKSAEELNSYKAQGMEARYQEAFSQATFTEHIFKLRIKAEQVNDEQRVKNTIAAIRPVNIVQECREMIKAIMSYG